MAPLVVTLLMAAAAPAEDGVAPVAALHDPAPPAPAPASPPLTFLDGVDLHLRAEVDALRNVSGGREIGGVVQRMGVVGLSADLERTWGWDGARAYVEVLSFGGGSISDIAGDVQMLAINEGPRRTILSEAWIEQHGGDGEWRLRLGKTDANSEFAAVRSGTLFSTGSFGNSPTIFVLPTYPDPAFGANLEWRPVRSASMKVGVYDGATANGISTGNHSLQTDEDLFLAGEVAMTWGDGDRGTEGRVSFGAWHHTADFSRFAGGVEDGTSGTWATLDQALWTGEGDERVAAFLQAGFADDEVTDFGRHLGGGLVWTGFVPGHGVGLGVSRIDLTDDPAAGLIHDDETTVEAFWRWQVTERFRLQPTVQAIHHPALAEDDALIVGCRFAWTL